jgi:MFS family permease
MVPIMAFVLAMAIYSGRRVTATGTYRRFPIAGTALTAVALYLFTLIGVSTPFWQAAIYMAVLGTGLGLTMQILMLAAQNSVPYRELGVATSMSMFSRSIGGSLGVAVFGTIFNNQLGTNLPKQVQQIPKSELTAPVTSALAKLHGPAVTENPAGLKHLPPVVHSAVQVAFSDSLHTVFLVGVPFALLAVLLTLRLREVPLRDATSPPPTPAPGGGELGEAFGMAGTADRPELDGKHESLAPEATSPEGATRGSRATTR